MVIHSQRNRRQSVSWGYFWWHAEPDCLDEARCSRFADEILTNPVRRKTARVPVEVVPVGKLIAVLADSEGMRTRELARATSGDRGQVLALLKEQESAGQVRRTGMRAATRWHVITDGDRIAARAAELKGRGRGNRSRKS